jgi:Tfp pilus assembly PilM family ATPase
MPQLLALEWSGNEARAALGSRHGQRTTIEQAFVIPLDVAAETEQTPQNVGQRIAAELAARDIRQIDVLVAVGRGSVELRQLQLPAAPDEELPRMVRLQALVEFNELDERWPLDFVPIDQPGQDTRTVLAAAMAPALGQRIEEVCQLCGLKMRRLVLRSCAAAVLAAKNPVRKVKSVPAGVVAMKCNCWSSCSPTRPI